MQEFVKSGEMYRFGRGMYVRSNAWEDDFYLLRAQVWALDLLARYRSVSAGLFRPYPGEIYDDLSQGLQCPVLEAGKFNCQARCAGNYEFGRIEIESPSGNPIRVYDLERTLCDILRGSGSDVQIVGEAMKRYAESKDKNIHKLMQYADQLRVKPKVLREVKR